MTDKEKIDKALEIIKIAEDFIEKQRLESRYLFSYDQFSHLMGNKGDTQRHYCKFCGKKLIKHSKPCVKKS